MKRILRLFVAGLFLVLGIGFLFGFEFYVKDKFDTVEVVVAKEPIDFKEQITDEHIEIKNVRKGTEVDNYISATHFESLIGKYASIKIEKGAQLYKEMIDTHDLVPNSKKGEFVAPIPKEWLFAVPGSLRRTYVADIYVVSNKDQAVIQSLIQQANQEEGKDESDVIRTDVKPNNAIPILTDVRVASVKDSANKEVKESKDTKEATGSVAALEIIATDESLDKIKTFAEQGYKLYVVYKFERGEGSNE